MSWHDWISTPLQNRFQQVLPKPCPSASIIYYLWNHLINLFAFPSREGESRASYWRVCFHHSRRETAASTNSIEPSAIVVICLLFGAQFVYPAAGCRLRYPSLLMFLCPFVCLCVCLSADRPTQSRLDVRWRCVVRCRWVGNFLLSVVQIANTTITTPGSRSTI